MFCLRHLRQARFDQDPAKIEDVRKLLSELREAWATISQQ
jgi:flagellin-specific chaperone FliS